MMSIRKSWFLWEEHGRMEQEVVALRQVDELRHKLESARREFQDWVSKAMGAWVVELRAVERATTAKQKLDVAKAHWVEIEVALRKSLEALEAEQKARSDAKREVVVLWMQMLRAEESNAPLLKR